jgi:beta-lactamase regulating signal transducer with metallopeptidase domain
MSFLLRHLLESTVFCTLLSVVACCLRRGATARHAVLLMGVAKFAIPTVLLAKTGGEIASLWPAASWVSYAASQISMALGVILNIVPAGWEFDLLLVWASGAVILGAVWCARLRQSRCPLTLPSELEEAAFLKAGESLRVPQTVLLRCTEDAVEPALRCIWRPTITIPKGLSDKLTRTEFEAVLLHELAHARRFDNLTSAFVHALVCLFWFHPLLWVLERRIQVERERACDETVMACGMKPQVYAASILKVCQFQLFAVTPGVSAMTGADLKERLDLILGDAAPARMLYVPWLLVASLTIFMTIVPIAGGYCEQCGSNGLQDSGTVVHCGTAATCSQRHQ